MAKFYGKIGYGTTKETSPGVWALDGIVEKDYYGDVIKDSKRWTSGEGLNDDLMIGNTISILADPFAYENFYNIKYVTWMGCNWKVNRIDVQRPRLLLSIGGIYNGDTATAPDTP